MKIRNNAPVTGKMLGVEVLYRARDEKVISVNPFYENAIELEGEGAIDMEGEGTIEVES